MSAHLNRIVDDARSAGILSDAATPIPHETRPWPVVLLTALGAWLAAVPLFGVVTMLLGDVLRSAPGLYFVGILTLAGSLVILRSRSVALFVEQLAVPALIVGGVSLGMAFFNDLPDRMACALVALSACAVARFVPHAWLRVLLGFVAGGFMTAALVSDDWFRGGNAQLLALYVTLSVWAAAYAALGKGAAGRHGAALESAGAGWILSVLLGCAVWAGVNLLADGGVAARLSETAMMQAASLALAAIAAAWLARRWPSTREPWLAGVAVVLIALAWMMPSLGAVLLVMALCATSGRWLLVGAGAVATAWVVGAFYYQLSFPLASKAAMLAGAGALLGLMAWIGSSRGMAPAAAEDRTGPANWARIRIGIVAALFAVLGVANVGIWRNQNLIANGQAVFVELAPVDPRSLMQGDYMRLNFNLPGGVDRRMELIGSRRPQVVAKTDARGVAVLLRLNEGQALAPGEFLIELSPKDGRWTLVTDAWFFKEGEARRWERAKYGEFRINPDGRALLVDLRGPALEKL